MTRPPDFPQTWPPPKSTNGDAPWWVRATYMLGVPAAIAIFLIYFVTMGVVAKLDGLDNSIRAHMRDQTLLLYYLSALCRNTAETDTERAGCEPPR